ncbi:MAG: sodium/proline symporter PutP [Gammaproteobacteria bacterium]|nr:MAG: sodium/proline symporter PutP [Gammaproteobacteria bacterium]
MNYLIATLILYQVLLLGIGWWASKRTDDNEDFYLGGRKLGAAVAALSASASSSSAWSLLGVSGAAYAWGLPAIWLIPSTLLGFVINWYWVAPRLWQRSRDNNALTLTEFLAGPPGDPARKTIMWLAAGVILFSFTFYVAAQFQAAGNTFAAALNISPLSAIVLGAAIVLAYVMLGGFWAASITDSLQGILMALSALVLPLIALSAVGGPGALIAGLDVDGLSTTMLWTRQESLSAGVGFVIGLAGIGLGYPGQPHVVNRFMAIEKRSAIPTARLIAISWAIVIYTGMVLLGWSGRVLMSTLGNGEQVLFELARQLLPSVFAGITVSVILSAIMSTADSQLLVAASSVSHDIRDSKAATRESLKQARWVVLIIGMAAIALAVISPAAIFSRVLFAWQALAAAFGPLLIITLWRGPVRPAWRIAAMSSGFVLTVLISWTTDTPGDIAERYIPMLVALAFAWMGSKHR